MAKKLFDFCIGNPPYNEDFNNSGDNKGYAAPVYDRFMEAAFEIADGVELIHPARFLFNAGSTPKAWNRKMLNDPHFKVLKYEENATAVFPNTDIKGGVAITYRDERYNYGPIDVFTKYPEMNSILHKITAVSGSYLSEIGVSSYAYHFTDEMLDENPHVLTQMSKGHANDLKSSVFEKTTGIFFDSDPGDEEYARIIGRLKNERVTKYIKRRYLNDVVNFYKYKLFIAKANGSGTFGETLAPPILGEPGVGSTETFLSFGSFNTPGEAQNLSKYIKAKMVRALLGILKTTQDVTPDKWKYVPIQDFTEFSDIDWKKSVHEIDLQLYRKYKLSKEEIDFIENNVKEMV